MSFKLALAKGSAHSADVLDDAAACPGDPIVRCAGRLAAADGLIPDRLRGCRRGLGSYGFAIVEAFLPGSDLCRIGPLCCIVTFSLSEAQGSGRALAEPARLTCWTAQVEALRASAQRVDHGALDIHLTGRGVAGDGVTVSSN